jgi:hypothetical protein
MLPYAQQGGQQDQVMQLIQMYAKMQGIDPRQIMQQLKQMSPQDQQQALQEISQAVQQQDQMMMYGGGLRKAQLGVETGNLTPEQVMKNAKKVSTAPAGYVNMGKIDNRTLYSKTTMDPAKGGLKPAMSGSNSGQNPEQYNQKMISMVQQGYSPEDLAKQGYISKENISKYSPYYTAPKMGTDYLYTEEDQPIPFSYADEFKGTTYYTPEGTARFRGRWKVQPQNSDSYEMYQMDNRGNRTGTYKVPNDVWYNKYTRDGYDKVFSEEGLEQYRIPDYKKMGGGININPANRGKFTASANRAGMGVQEFASQVLANKEDYSPLQVKRANFARNAAGWNNQYGGVSVGDEMEVTPAQLEYLRQQGIDFDIIG